MFDAFVTSARDTTPIPFAMQFIPRLGIHCLEGLFVDIDATDGTEGNMQEVMQ